MNTPSPLLTLDIGGTKVAWALAHPAVAEDATVHSLQGAGAGADLDDDLAIHLGTDPGERGSIPTQAQHGGPALARRVQDLVAEVIAHTPVRGVSISSAGVVDPSTGTIISATDTIPGWGGTPLGALVAETAGAPVAVLNDVHAHGLGEALFGHGRGLTAVLVVAVGTGIGGAYVVDGEVATGAHHLAGHIGHVHHAGAAGLTCSCGRRGHIEAIASGTGLARWYGVRHQEGREAVAKDGAEVARRAAAGDEVASAVITESGYALGEVLGSGANCLDPDLILLTGSVTALGEPWWERVREGYAAAAMDGVAATPLRPGALGGDAPLLGAAAHFDRTHLDPAVPTPVHPTSPSHDH